MPFLDEAQVDAGADFEEDILNFLERAHELVVLLTPLEELPAGKPDFASVDLDALFGETA